MIVTLIALALLLPCAAPQQSADDAYARAWYALEVQRQPTEASAQFTALIADASAPRPLRARATLGLARCERLLGQRDGARARLAQLAQESVDLPGIAAEVQAELALLAGSHTRYITGIETLRAGQYLDLDTGGLMSSRDNGTGNAPEISMEGGVLRFDIVRADILPASVADLPDALPRLGDAPWMSIVTDAGRDAWVQALNAPPEGQVQPDLAVRYVTRLAGEGPVLPAPHNPFCVGYASAIEVWFDAAAEYERYRVERRISIEGTFVTVATPETPPFHDTDVKDGVRYGYRITGITGAGDEGIPVIVQGSTKSAGIVSGRCVFAPGHWPQSFDLLQGKLVERGGDLTLTGLWGGGDQASFADHLGRRLFATLATEDALVSPWAPVAQSGGQGLVRPTDWFILRLVGGGVARCRLVQPSTGEAITVDYTVNPDGEAFPPGPALDTSVVSGAARTIEIGVTPRDGYVVRDVSVRDVVTDSPPRLLEVVQGMARDGEAPDTLLEYRAVGVDAHGRRGADGITILNLLPEGISTGQFAFTYEKGYSIERRMQVPADVADVVFESCAGGISSITLSAPGGICNLQDALGEAGGDLHPAEILEHLLGADPDAVRLKPRAEGDDREPCSDVFVLRTRHGGWAALAITKRGESGGWTERPATVQFAFNAHAPVFGDLTRPHETIKGLTLVPLPQVVQPPEPVRSLHPKVEWPAGPSAGSARRPVAKSPDAGTLEPEQVQTGRAELLARSRHNDYEKATFSFEFGVRDDPGDVLTRNDWELEYGNGDDTFAVNMVTDDRSTIADLGALSFADPTTLSPPGVTACSELAVREGHVYVVRTHDSDSNHVSLFRVEALAPGDRCTIAWVDLRAPGTHATDPLELGAELRLRLGRLLALESP